MRVRELATARAALGASRAVVSHSPLPTSPSLPSVDPVCALFPFSFYCLLPLRPAPHDPEHIRHSARTRKAQQRYPDPEVYPTFPAFKLPTSASSSRSQPLQFDARSFTAFHRCAHGRISDTSMPLSGTYLGSCRHHCHPGQLLVLFALQRANHQYVTCITLFSEQQGPVVPTRSLTTQTP